MPSATDSNKDVFSTPPTTPSPPEPANGANGLRPSISRHRNSRPSSIHTEHPTLDWKPDITILDGVSPNQGNTGTPVRDGPGVATVKSPSSATPVEPRSRHNMQSPCYVHSHLDKSASLTEWLRSKQPQSPPPLIDVSPILRGDSRSQRHKNTTSDSHSRQSSVDGDDDEDEFNGSLTKQLADTAVGVREMSKQLGRARVKSSIQNVLIITKARDNKLIKLTRKLALYLMLKRRNGHHRGLVVYVDHQLRKSKRFDADRIRRDHPDLFHPIVGRRSSSSASVSSSSSTSTHNDPAGFDEGQLRYWTPDMCSSSPHLFDFIVTLGGDGTVLFTSWLFQRIVPPVLSFALGSLGFLTNFDFADHQAVMDTAIDAGIRVNLRMRFNCTVYRAVSVEAGKGRKAVKKAETGEIMMKNLEKGGWEALEGGWSGHAAHESCKGKDREIMCYTTRPVETFQVLNDLVVDRGPSPYVSLLELFGDEHHMTTVQADGLTVSTPTGSTAYSLSAGGSLVHPEIPAILITPICPHTLSFRPMLLPDSMELRICVPYNSRSTAWASFDGRGRVELRQGDHIKVTASQYPFPTVCADRQSTDWFHSISRTLKWNERERQKSFVVVEEGPEKPTLKKKHSLADGPSAGTAEEYAEAGIEEDDTDEEEEGEEGFDITDSSPEAALKQQDAKPAHTGDNAINGRHKSDDTISPSLKRKTDAATHHRSHFSTRTMRHHLRSKSTGSAIRFDVHTPNRFAKPRPDPLPEIDFGISPTNSESSASSVSSSGFGSPGDDPYGVKSPPSTGRGRFWRDREHVESMKTPTVKDSSHGRRSQSNSRPPSSDYHPRAFAVWGQDESDSNASESETDF